ncbi:MAG: SDR family oxidoreductase [Chloroflexi bacterium]|nr:SDR family oxidoreductase [Chloroflexota bacterium]
MRFDNKVVLVTGAAQGIGAAIAKQFLAAGARVALNDRTPERAETGVAKLGGAQANLLGVAADVTRRAEVEAMIARIVERFGRLDIVVNNAGLYPVTPVLDMREEEWDTVLDVNLKGTFLVSQAAARQMVRQGSGGAIVNISSGSHKVARIGCAHYCASKAGIVMFTQVLAMELAPHRIRVNAVAPGLIEVPDQLTPGTTEYMADTLAVIPAARLGTPDDIAQAVLLLADPAADYITGAVLAVDGGLSVGRMPPRRHAAP